MGRLDTNATLQAALNNNDPFLYAHLVKFERPLAQLIDLPNGDIRYETDATRYAYITDAAYDINFDDGSTNSSGTSNGSQTYRANKLTKVSSIQEASTTKVSSLSLVLNASGVDASITGTFSIAQSLSTVIGEITITSGGKWVDNGFQEGDRIKFSSGNNSTKYFRIRTIKTSTTAQIELLTLKDASGTDLTITGEIGFPATLSMESDEIVALLRDTVPTSFVNRKVSIYKVFLDPDNPSIFIGNPLILFKGAITTASYKEDSKAATATWGIKNHWGDFQQVRGRLTSDDFHRALKPNSSGQLVGNPEATIRPEYAKDKGFVHAEQSINIIGTYITQETHTVWKRKKGIKGWFGRGKNVEITKDVERETDLRFDLEARYLPVIYGVRRLNGNLVFADTASNDSGEVFIAEALCEGPIHGIYNIYVEDNSIICVDKPDSDVRAGGSTAVDVVCIGRTDKGEVMSGGPLAHASSMLSYIYDNDDSNSLWWNDYGGSSHMDSNTYYNNYRKTADYNSIPFNAGSIGMVHDQGFKINAPTSVSVEFKAGTADQDASNMLVDQAHGDKFKIQTDYWGSSGSGDYWSESHQLLDTSYVVTRHALTDDQTTVPDLEYVVKGKVLDCYNYDGSFTHDPNPAHSSENHTYFILGETVDIKNSSDTVIADDVMIIDKWSFDAGEYASSAGDSGWRFRWNLTTAQQTALNNAKTFYMTDGTNNWHMVTHDYSLSFKAEKALVSPVTSVETTGSSDLEVILNSPSGPHTEFEDAMGGSDFSLINLIGANNHALGSMFTATYNASTNRATFVGSKSAGATTTNTSVIIANKIALKNNTDTLSSVNDFYKGAVLTLTKALNDGNKLDIVRIIKSYDGTNKIATLTEPYSLVSNDNNIKLYPDDNDIVTIKVGYDKRVSTNPALIAYDYITNKRYGPGVEQVDINQNSFLNAAVTCDTTSDITVTLDSSQSFTAGAVYKWVSGVFKWQGTVKTSGTGTSVTFINCIGKLTNKWNNWKERQVGDLVWTHVGGNQQLYRLTAQGYQSTNLTNGATSQGANFTLTKVSGTGSDLTVDANGGNPVSYSLYDGDEVKYWKYLGWEDQDQRWATRHQTNIIVNTDQPVFSNISAILQHFNGILTYVSGQYTLSVETSSEEVLDGSGTVNQQIRFIKDEDIIGAINIKDQGLSKSFNSLSASIDDPQNSFNGRSVSFFNSDYLKEDRGIVKSTSFKMPGITNYFNARMAVKQTLDQSRFNREISFTMRPAGLAITCGEVIAIQYPRFNWTGKQFRVKTLTLSENCLINIVAEEYNASTYLVPAASDTVFKLNASTEAVTRVPSAPSNLTATTGATEKVGQINLSWTAPTTPPATSSGRYEIYRATGQSGDAGESVTAHATLIATVASGITSYVDKPEVLEGNFYYWVRAANTLQIQTTSSRETRDYYGDFNANSNSGVLGSISAIQQVKLESQDYSVIYDEDGDTPAYTGTGSNIVITATAQGFSAPQYEFKLAGSTVQNFSTTATYNFAVPSSIFSPSKVIQVGVREGGSGVATQTDTISIIAVQPGIDGVTPKLVVVTPSTNVMFKDTFPEDFPGSDDVYYSPTGINIKAQTANTTANGVWSTSAGTLTSIVNTHTAPSCVVSSANIVDGMVVTYTLHADDGSSADSTTLELIETADGAITPVLSNEAHVLPASTAGAVSSYTGSGTDITVYEGATKLDYDGTGTANGHWTVAIGNTANITEGTASSGGSGNGRYAVISDHSAAADGTDVYTITYTITGKSAIGTAFSHTKTQTISKSKTGVTGDHSYTVSMPNSSHTVAVNNVGAITFTGSGTNIQVFRGSTELEGILSGTPGADEFVVTGRAVSPSGAFDTSGSDNSGLGAITQAAGADKHLVVADFTEMNASVDVGTVTYTLNLGNVQTSVSHVQSITKSKEGTDAVNSRYPTLYRLNSSTRVAGNGTFADPRAGNTDWNYAVPTMTANGHEIYAMSRIFTSDGNSPQEAAWPTPGLYASRIDGTSVTGPAGQGTRQVNLYKLNDTSLSNTTTGTFANPIYGNTDWSYSVPSLAANNDKIYVATRTFTSDAASPQDSSWSTPVIYAQRTDGTQGDPGLNTATASLYRKNTSNSSAPAAFSGTFTYTFATGAITGGTLNSWTDTIPDLNTGEYAWVRQATASSSSSTDTIATSEFSSAVVHSGGGEVGAAGNSNAIVSLYRVSTNGSSAPSAFSGTFTYTFATGAVTGGTLNSWTTAVPTVPKGSYLWVRQATASSNTSTDSVAASEFSGAVVSSASGDDGDNGSNVNIIFIRAATQPNPPSASSGIPGSWSDSPPSGTAPLWASKGVTAVNGTVYTWGATYRAEGTAVAEVYAFRMNSSSGLSGGSFNFTNSTLSPPSNWSVSPPAITANGQEIYVGVGIASGAPTDTSASITWQTPVLQSKRVDGTDAVNTRYPTLYRLNSASSASTAGSYADPTDGQHSDWQYNVPNLTADGHIVYAMTRIFTSDGNAPQQSSWSTPAIYARRVDGDTITGDAGPRQVNIYNLNDNTLASATSGTYASPLATDNSNDGWQYSVPSITADGHKVYVSTRTFTHDGSNQDNWSSPTIFSQRTDGATGQAAYTVSLSASKYVISYNIDGAETTEGSITFTAAPQGIQGTATYKFDVDGSVKQTEGTSPTYVMADSDEPASGVAKLVKVTMYDGGAEKATDSVSVYGIKEGEDAVTIVLTNEAIALPTTSGGTVNYADSGTDIRVFSGNTPLEYGNAANKFEVSTSVSNITAGSPSTVSTYTRRYANASDITSQTALITYTITVKNALSTATTYTKIQSFNKTVDGDPGADGAGTTTIYYIVSGVDAPDTPGSGTDSTPGSWTATVPSAVSGSSRWFSLGTKPQGSNTWTWGAPQMYQSADNFAWGGITIIAGGDDTQWSESGGSYNPLATTQTLTLTIAHPTLGTSSVVGTWTRGNSNATQAKITAFALGSGSGAGGSGNNDWTFGDVNSDSGSSDDVFGSVPSGHITKVLYVQHSASNKIMQISARVIDTNFGGK